jgi:hypothetical protein
MGREILLSCPLCHREVVVGDKGVVETDKGCAYRYECILKQIFEKLEEAGIPKPMVSDPNAVQKFLRQKAEEFLKLPVSLEVERQLGVIMKISKEFFGFEMRLSGLVTG